MCRSSRRLKLKSAEKLSRLTATMSSIRLRIKTILTGALLQVPALGGTPRKILSNIGSPISFFSDGTRIALCVTTMPAQAKTN